MDHRCRVGFELVLMFVGEHGIYMGHYICMTVPWPLKRI